jgi:hypothetical protein
VWLFLIYNVVYFGKVLDLLCYDKKELNLYYLCNFFILKIVFISKARKGGNALVRNAILYVIFIQCLIISGCSSFKAEGIQLASEKETDITLKEVPSKPFFNDSKIIPIDLDGGQFNSVGDWYDNTSVLFTVNEGSGSKIYKYHIYEGDTELFYKTPEQVISLEGNQNQHYFVVHTAVSAHEAKLIVLDKEGKEVLNWIVESVELQYVWNPFDENQLFITSFLEDWSFKNFVMNADTKRVVENGFPQPFIQWMDTSELAYLKWDDTSLDAPLYTSNLETKEEKKVLDNVLAFHSYKDLLLAISSAEESSLYQFYEPKTMKKIQEFQIPTITTFSDRWWIPNYEYNTATNKFYYFKPVVTGEEIEALSLVSFSMKTGEEEVVLSQSEDLPLKISPDGKRVLFGFQFMKLIDLLEKETYTLINQT